MARTSGGYNLSLTRIPRSSGAAFTRSYEVNIGLTYHFLGLLDAPGIVPISTLMPWGR